MLTAIRLATAATLCSICALAAVPAQEASEAEPTSRKELDKLPVALNVTHDPQPTRATETPNSKRLCRYTWFFKTTVRAIDTDVQLTEFGAYSWVGGEWESRSRDSDECRVEPLRILKLGFMASSTSDRAVERG